MRFVKVLMLVVAVSLVPLAASADNYVLSASNWGAKQASAVQAAGGTVVWAHGGSGVALVSSSAPDFLQRASASNAFHSVDADMVVQWQPPVADYAVDAAATISPGNDTFYPLQWPHQAVESPAAWAAGCTGDGVRVAIVDGGIFSTHPDLDANIDVACSASFVPSQPFNNDVGTFWHGTHVAGIVAAEDNNIGVVGIAPEATILGVKVLHNGSGSFGAVIGGILYSADPAAFGATGCARADIINMSLGAEFPKNQGQGLVSALSKAMNFAASKGVLVISAAGNSGIDYGQAGNFVNVPGTAGSGIAVSATAPLAWAYGATNFSRPASYSNFGEGYVSVAAPGGDFAYPGNENCTLPTATGTITRPCWVFDLYLSTARGTTAAGTYAWAAGTSMATPATSAVAALIKQRFPGISLGALKTELFRATTDEGAHEFYGHGFVNARKACTE